MEGIPEDEYRASVSFLWSAAAFFCWTTLYTCLCVWNPRRSYEWHCRIVTVIHGLTVTAMSAWCGFVQGPWPFTHPGGPITPLQRLTVSVCLGYFIFDIMWCTYFKTEGLMMVLHHTISVTGSAMVLYMGISGTEFIAAIFGSEATNPFLQTRWFLRQINKHKTWYGEVNDLVFMLLFGYLRLGIGSNLLYWYLIHPRPYMFPKLGGVLFWLIGAIWFVQILMYARKKYALMYRAWSHGKVVYVDPDSEQNVNKDKNNDNNQNGKAVNGYNQHKEKVKTS